MPPDVLTGFLTAMGDAGIEADQVIETTKLNDVRKAWKRITKFLQGINELALLAAITLGEEDVDDDD